MCLYPRLIFNPKYKRNKKNGGVIPAIPDKRVQMVPIGCNVCIECRKQKARNWQTRLTEDIKEHANGKFVTLTFSTENLKSIYGKLKNVDKLKGYDIDNAIVTYAVRHFLERWRKKHKKSLRHWLITELGDGTTEHIHLHGIIWINDPTKIQDYWQYGNVWYGYQVNGKLENYVSARTVNYITKYVTKIDELHLNYQAIILCSPGIGRRYVTSGAIRANKFKGDKTDETYRTSTGHKIAMPIYWRNKIYTEEEREKLWLMKLDKNSRFVCGEKVDADSELYYEVLNYHRERSIQLGYPAPEFIWKRKKYEEERREILMKRRLEIE